MARLQYIESKVSAGTYCCCKVRRYSRNALAKIKQGIVASASYQFDNSRWRRPWDSCSLCCPEDCWLARETDRCCLTLPIEFGVLTFQSLIYSLCWHCDCLTEQKRLLPNHCGGKKWTKESLITIYVLTSHWSIPRHSPVALYNKMRKVAAESNWFGTCEDLERNTIWL